MNANRRRHFGYQLALWLLLPLVIIFSLIHARRRGANWRYLPQRLAFGYQNPQQGAIWLHAASVGEVALLAPLIDYQLQRETVPTLLLSITSPTGLARAYKLYAPYCQRGLMQICYAPLDYPCCVHRFIKTFAPVQCLIVETEMWLNLYRAAADFGIAPIMINARLSPKTTDSKLLRGIWQSCLQEVRTVLAKSDADLKSYQSLGAPASSRVIGNLKLAQNFAHIDAHPEFSGDYIVAVSTHHDEEWQLLSAFLQEPQLADYRWIFIPRHAERGQKLQAELQKISPQLIGRKSKGDPPSAIYIADTTGEAAAIIKGARACFVGGSLIKHGGQNVLEPAHLGVATFCGPSVYNFSAEVDKLAQLGGIVICNSAQEVAQSMVAVLTDKHREERQLRAAGSIFADADAIVAAYYQILRSLRA